MEPAKRPVNVFSIEGLLAAFGLYSLVSGIVREEMLSIFWGIMIICGMVVLYFVRRKDWKKHWEEMETRKEGS